jgi:hypothetical protein
MEHAGSSPDTRRLFEWVPVEIQRGIFRAGQEGPPPWCPRSLRPGKAVTIRALHQLDLAGSGLLKIYAMPAAASIPALLDRLDQGARFRSAEA